MARSNLTAERLRELLDYDPKTGIFRWRTQTSHRIEIGDVAGSLHGAGYTQINIDRHNYLAHRLAWLHMHGEWPKHHIDHMNANRRDNRAENLRDLRQSINNQNVIKPFRTNRSGFLGVSWSAKEKVWVATISENNCTRRIGTFQTREAAHAAYVAEKRKVHEGCML